MVEFEYLEYILSNQHKENDSKRGREEGGGKWGQKFELETHGSDGASSFILDSLTESSTLYRFMVIPGSHLFSVPLILMNDMFINVTDGCRLLYKHLHFQSLFACKLNNKLLNTFSKALLSERNIPLAAEQ